MKHLKIFEEHSDINISHITIDKCPSCGKSHKYLKSDTELKNYNRLFICPDTEKMFQASVSIK